jgi:integrase
MAEVVETARDTSLFIPILLWVTTGMRRGEVAALRWRHVDLDRAQISVEEAAEQTKGGVRYKSPKSGKGRTVALPATVVAELRSHRIKQAQALLKGGIRLSDDVFVVCQADGSPFQPRSLTHAFETFVARHDLPRIRLHDLRHAHATAMLKGNIHPKIVQERLGHSTISVTLDIYSHVLEGMQEDAAGIVDAALQAAINERRKKIG